MAAVIQDLIAERENTHGAFADQGRVAQSIKRALRKGPNWRRRLNARQREALDMIASKMARIACGDPDHPDHWRDIAGYATLISEGARP